MASNSDPFELFAMQRGLQFSAEELCAAPRDVLAPPAELERHMLVTLTSSTEDVAAVRMVFVRAATDPRPPTLRDTLWWLASDSWAIEQAKHDYHRWSELYKYPEPDTAATRLFDLHARQAKALATLLDESGYAKLLALYEDEVRAGRSDQNIENLVSEAKE